MCVYLILVYLFLNFYICDSSYKIFEAFALNLVLENWPFQNTTR